MSDSHATERNDSPQVASRRDFLTCALAVLAAPVLARSAAAAGAAPGEPAILAEDEPYGSAALQAGLRFREQYGITGEPQPEHLWSIIRSQEPALVIRRGGRLGTYVSLERHRGAARLPEADDPGEEVWLLAWAVTMHLFRDFPSTGCNCPLGDRLTDYFLDGLEGAV